MDDSFYKWTGKWGYEASISSGLKNGTITDDDRGLILEFILERQAQDQIRDHRINQLGRELVNFRRYLTAPYRTASVADVFTGINRMKAGTNLKGKPYSQHTVAAYMRTVKPFLLWMIDNGYSSIPRQKVKGIKRVSPMAQTTTPDQLLTMDEVLQLLTACQNSRDRALVSTLYESGCRVGELARLVWKDIIFDKYGVRCYVTDTKNNLRRYSRLTVSHQYLATWKNDTKDSSPDARVFVNLITKEPVNYVTIRLLLNRLVARAKITKRVTPHLFRKSRITHMVAQNYQESVIKKSMWGNLSTDMFSTYVCLAEQDIDAEILDKAGIERKSDTVNPLAPIPCPVCHHVNPPAVDWCNRCGTALSTEAKEAVRGVQEYVIAHPDTSASFFAERRSPP